jgi:antitoxin ChpS
MPGTTPAIMTIPAEVLKQLAVEVGESLDLEVSDGVMLARPAQTNSRRRLRLSELLDGVTPALARQMAAESAEWHSGAPVGRELL